MREDPSRLLLDGCEYLLWRVPPVGCCDMFASKVCRVESVTVSGDVVEKEFRRGLLAKGTLRGLGDSPLATMEDENILCECPPNIDWLIGTERLDAKGSVKWIGVIKDLGETVSAAEKPRSCMDGEKSIA